MADPAPMRVDLHYISFNYVNYRGEASRRNVCVSYVRWGSSEWHPEKQWLLGATDLEKREFREFAMRDMRDVG